MTSNCQDEYDQIIRETKELTDKLLTEARHKVDDIVLDAYQRIGQKCSDYVMKEMTDAMDKLRRSTEKSVREATKEVDKFLDTFKKSFKWDVPLFESSSLLVLQLNTNKT